MAKAPSYTKAGSKQTEAVTLDKAIFGLELNAQLIKDAYNAYLSNGRSAQPTTLTRGMVRGGGKKPWRQKGTGRARVGSIRVPNWKGGGIVFGPTGIENHIVQLPVKMKRVAIRQALSVQAADNRVMVIEDFAVDGKTKATAQLLAKLGAAGKVLVVVSEKTNMIDRATRNLPGVTVTQATYVNVFQVMNADDIIITRPAMEQIEAWLGAKTEVKPTEKVAESKVSEEKPAADAKPAEKIPAKAEAKKPVAKKPAAKKEKAS